MYQLYSQYTHQNTNSIRMKSLLQYFWLLLLYLRIIKTELKMNILVHLFINGRELTYNVIYITNKLQSDEE